MATQSDLRIEIFLIEDHPDFRESLSFLLNSNEQFACTSFPKVEDAIRCLENEQPNIIIMDINLPGMSGIEGTKLIKEKYPSIQIMMCTVYEDDVKIFEALKAGASAYLLKRAAIDEIFSSIIDLYNGGSPMTPSIARKVVASFQSPTPFILSDREQEILHLLSEGFRAKEISEKLFISLNTVKTHVRHLYEKLQVTSKIQAVNKATKKIPQSSDRTKFLS